MLGLLQPLFGAAVILAIAVAFSTNRRAIRWSTVAWGLGLQVVFAIIDSEKAGQGPPRISVLKASGDKGAGGIEIKGVNPEGPGGKAGLKAGDIVKTVDGKAAETVQALNTLLQNARPGQKFTVAVTVSE